MSNPYSSLCYVSECKLPALADRPMLNSCRTRTAVTSQALHQHLGDLMQQHNDLKASLRTLQDAQNSFQTAQDQISRSQEASRAHLMDVKHKTEAIW